MSMDRLIEKIRLTGNPSVMGLDPNSALIPKFLVEQAKRETASENVAYALAAYRFNCGLMDAAQGLIPAVKPQSAYYELYGPPGVKVFYDTVAYAKKKGFYVIADVKRNDIGTTAQAYAKAYLHGGQNAPFGTDSATVNPYLGTDGIKPFAELCKAEEKSIFVLVKTSNPSSGELQDLKLSSGETLYERVAHLVDQWGEDSIGDEGFSNVGAVVGATYPKIAEDLRKIMPHTFFLVPGYGAQGATAKDIAVSFRPDGLGAIVNSSRGIMNAYQKQGRPEEEFQECARREIIRMRDEIVGALS